MKYVMRRSSEEKVVNTKNIALGVMMLVTGLAAISVLGQSGGTGGGGRQGGGQDPAAQENNIMLQLIANDQDFAALQPLVEKVIYCQHVVSSGGRGAPDPNANGQNLNDVQQAAADLRDAMNDPASTTAQIQLKLTALRAARVKAREDLVEAQRELEAVLTVRQEAALSLSGFLE